MSFRLFLSFMAPASLTDDHEVKVARTVRDYRSNRQINAWPAFPPCELAAVSPLQGFSLRAGVLSIFPKRQLVFFDELKMLRVRLRTARTALDGGE